MTPNDFYKEFTAGSNYSPSEVWRQSGLPGCGYFHPEPGGKCGICDVKGEFVRIELVAELFDALGVLGWLGSAMMASISS
ncbi:hypothetical protein EOD23_10035 [Mesorhizobium sp. USDA-HM6]|nr:hypothetical protein EOD23_10035 [Mesorhizobium sp. USDA-HM6]